MIYTVENMLKRTVMIFLLLVLAGCGKDSVINGKSEETFNASVLSIIEDLPDKKRLEFTNSLNLLYSARRLQYELTGTPQNKIDSAIRTSFHAKTADQVIQDANDFIRDFREGYKNAGKRQNEEFKRE